MRRHEGLPRRTARWAAGLLVGCAIGLAPATAPPAQAAPSWLASEYVSGPLDLGYFYEIPAATVMDFDGNTTVLWRAFDGTNDRVGGATRLAGDAFKPLGWISPQGSDAQHPRIDVDASGRRVAAWDRFMDESHWGVEYAKGTATAGFGTPLPLSPPSQGGYFPEVAANGRGDAVAVWKRSHPFTYGIEASIRPAGGDFGESQAISEDDLRFSCNYPQVAIDSSGNAIAVWQQMDASRNSVIKAAVRGAHDQRFDPPVTASDPGLDSTYPQVAIAEQGTGVVAWRGEDAGGQEATYAATVSPEGSPGAPAPISPPASGVGTPQVETDSSGNAIAVWYRSTGQDWRVESAARPAGGSFGPPKWLSDEGVDAAQPQLDFDGEGNAIIAWQRDYDGHDRIQVVNRTAAGELSEPKWISSSGRSAVAPQVAFDCQGNAIVSWLGLDDDVARVEAAGYDDGGPKLEDLKIPTYGVAGKPIAFSVSPLDVWSLVTATHWTFGEGGTAEGSSATHVYRRPGLYQVRVTSTDLEGNSSSAQRLLRIGASSSPAQPRTGQPRERGR